MNRSREDWTEKRGDGWAWSSYVSIWKEISRKEIQLSETAYHETHNVCTFSKVRLNSPKIQGSSFMINWLFNNLDKCVFLQRKVVHSSKKSWNNLCAMVKTAKLPGNLISTFLICIAVPGCEQFRWLSSYDFLILSWLQVSVDYAI